MTTFFFLPINNPGSFGPPDIVVVFYQPPNVTVGLAIFQSP